MNYTEARQTTIEILRSQKVAAIKALRSDLQPKSAAALEATKCLGDAGKVIREINESYARAMATRRRLQGSLPTRGGTSSSAIITQMTATMAMFCAADKLHRAGNDEDAIGTLKVAIDQFGK